VTAIDWDSFDVQRLVWDPLCTDEQIIAWLAQAEHDAGLDRLRAALAELPDLTWRMRVRLAYWDARDFLERIRLAL
jgi:hypothetical protein